MATMKRPTNTYAMVASSLTVSLLPMLFVEPVMGVCVCDKSKGLETRLTRVSVRSVREIASSQYTFTHGVRSVVEQLLRAAVIHHSTIRTHLQSMGCGDGVKIIVWLRDGDG